MVETENTEMFATHGLYTAGKATFVIEFLGLVACLAGFYMAWIALPA